MHHHRHRRDFAHFKRNISSLYRITHRRNCIVGYRVFLETKKEARQYPCGNRKGQVSTMIQGNEVELERFSQYRIQSS